jgi:20S proteasome alpha/beta subunit
VTGTSVVGVKFNGGVAIATDNLGTVFLVSFLAASSSN